MKNYTNLYNSNTKVQNKVDWDKEGGEWGLTWFMSPNGTSRHCQGIALDLTLTDSSGNELTMQSKIHTLDTSSVTKFNIANSNRLYGYMYEQGFDKLKSEWWHFEDNTYNYKEYKSFYLE